MALTSPTPALVPVRDSKDPSGPVLLFPAASWQSFVSALRDGSLSVGQ
ncbi:DUF397 domain-containing protein [Kitasatospora purpeofusca]